MKNICTVFVVPLLSMIFLASSARADDDKQSSPHDQKVNSAHHEQSKKDQKDVRHKGDQQPTHHEKHRDQGKHGDRGRYRGPIRIFNYVGIPFVGMVVNELPADHMSVVIDDVTYALYQGVFYKRIFSGYQVVDPSTVVLGESFFIDIINSNGGFTRIQMDVLDDGFIGPQGEFYPQFPSFQQLRAMYIQ